MTGFDLAAYTRRVREGPCFVCALVAGDPAYRHHVVYDDGEAIAFLSRYPTLRGYCLVAPRRHVEDWVRELDAAQIRSHLARQPLPCPLVLSASADLCFAEHSSMGLSHCWLPGYRMGPPLRST